MHNIINTLTKKNILRVILIVDCEVIFSNVTNIVNFILSPPPHFFITKKGRGDLQSEDFLSFHTKDKTVYQWGLNDDNFRRVDPTGYP